MQGLNVICGSGDPSLKHGLCIYTFSATLSMTQSAIYSSDGDFLLVAESGRIYIKSEFGDLIVEPCEIVVIPRGIRFSVLLIDNIPIRGYAVEVFEGHFELPGNFIHFHTYVISFILYEMGCRIGTDRIQWIG